MLYNEHIRNMMKSAIQIGTVEGIPPLTLPKSKGKNLKDYRIYGNSYQRLPQEYQEVEYIEGDGNSYINTDYILTSSTKAEIKYQYATMPIRPSKQAQAVFGAYESGHSFQMSYNGLSLSGLSNKYISSTPTIDGYEPSQLYESTSKYVVVVDAINGTYTINDTVAISGVTFTPSTIYNHFYLFARNGAALNKSTPRIYYTKIWDNGVLQRDLVPCYRKSDNEVGMYDLVENKFYTNADTGTFTKGAGVVPTPEKPIEIESVGDKTKNIFNYKEQKQTAWANIDKTKPSFVGWNGAGQTTSKIFAGVASTSSILIPCTTSDTVYLKLFSATGGTARRYIGEFDINGICIQKSNYTGEVSYTPVNNDCVYVCLEWAIDTTDDSGVMITKNEPMPATYEEFGYRIHITAKRGTNTVESNVYVDAPLRKIGDYADYIDFKNQKVVRNIGEYQITGKETWYQYEPNPTHILCSLLSSKKQGISYTKILATHMIDIGNHRFVYSNSSGRTFDFVNGFEYLDASDITEFKNRLEELKIRFNYIYVEPTEETIELPEILTAKGTCILSVGTNVQPSNMYVKYIK